MKVLTLHQPWASLVALGVKTIETRSWSTQYRGPLAIHAAARRVQRGQWIGEWHTHLLTGDIWRPDYPDRPTVPLPLGAIVATCTLVDVVPIVGQPMRKMERAAVDAAGHYLLRAVGGLGREILGLFGADGMGICSTNGNAHEHPFAAAYPYGDHTGQKPYGDFTLPTRRNPKPRYAWLLADVVPADPPVPFKGGQGLTKTWEPVAA